MHALTLQVVKVLTGMSKGQKNSRRLKPSIPKSALHRRRGQGASAGLPFLVPEILEFIALRRFRTNFPAFFPQFSSGTPEKIPETATAFSSFLEWHFN